MAVRTTITTEIAENADTILAATFVDEAGATLSSLDSLTLTLWEESTEDIINSRDASDVSASLTGGVLSLALATADNAIVTSKLTERHVALFEWTYDSGTKLGKHEVVFTVTNLVKVP